ncbi:TatD family hydrolase [Marichromatium bheemlicum]|uniref:TatD family hydrolase n=1 Tax=Marichromatium bheemlicum TaxID=365339 RepID=A0ABX1I370_9GAMM|nr:TatD family hydrolase [Marichromatium bheemlicum]NKN31712.1 TatD family hydrolase [Marichromatium bheemlicum]
MSVTELQLIDTHCHLDLPVFDPDRAAVLAAAHAIGVETLVVPAIEQAGWSRVLAQRATATAARPACRVALGLHPLYLPPLAEAEATLAALQSLLAAERPVAIGEIGLDFHRGDADRAYQLALFEAQLVLAREARLPVLLHVRKAHEEVLAALARIGGVGGIAHAFSGSLQQAARYLDRGFRLGFGGMLTFARSTRLRRLARALPVDALVLETDAPDMTVAAHRGERNSPAYLDQVLAALAEVRDESPQMLAAHTTANARAVLAL